MISKERLRAIALESGFGPTYPDAERFARAVEAEAMAELRAENERLRAALLRIAAIEDRMVGSDWEEITEARAIANAALGEKL